MSLGPLQRVDPVVQVLVQPSVELEVQEEEVGPGEKILGVVPDGEGQRRLGELAVEDADAVRPDRFLSGVLRGVAGANGCLRCPAGLLCYLYSIALGGPIHLSTDFMITKLSLFNTFPTEGIRLEVIS